MSKAAEILKTARSKQIRARYARHYEEGDNFVIEALTPEFVVITIKPHEAPGLLGDLLKYVFSNCKQIDEDY